MFRPHNPNATATAVIQGLAIAKYNESESRWEVTFLRNCGHYPKLKIREINKQTGTVISNTRAYEIKSGDSISVSVSDSKGGAEWKYTTPGAFDRENTKHDAQDLRWMLDIENLHGRKVKRKDGGIETNSLFISDGVFYTSVRTKEVFRIKKIGSAVPEFLGLTGQTFGADFEGSGVTIKVTGSDRFTETLPHKNNSRYELIFDNTCTNERQPENGETDFHLYYRLIDERDGKVELLTAEESSPVALTGDASTSSSADNAGTEPDSTDPPPPPPGEESDPENPKRPPCQAIMEGVFS